MSTTNHALPPGGALKQGDECTHPNKTNLCHPALPLKEGPFRTGFPQWRKGKIEVEGSAESSMERLRLQTGVSLATALLTSAESGQWTRGQAGGACFRKNGRPGGFRTIRTGRGPVLEPGKWARFWCQKGEAQQLGLTLLALFRCPENGLRFGVQKVDENRQFFCPFSQALRTQRIWKLRVSQKRRVEHESLAPFPEAPHASHSPQDCQCRWVIWQITAQSVLLVGRQAPTTCWASTKKCCTRPYNHPWKEEPMSFAHISNICADTAHVLRQEPASMVWQDGFMENGSKK